MNARAPMIRDALPGEPEIDREPADEDDRDRVWHVATNAAGGVVEEQRACREAVVAGDHVVIT